LAGTALTLYSIFTAVAIGQMVFSGLILMNS
jgi:hypothetical protein